MSDNTKKELAKSLRKAMGLSDHNRVFNSVIDLLADKLADEGYSKATGWEEGVPPLDTQLRYSLLEDSETPKDYATNEIVYDVRRANIMTDIPLTRRRSIFQGAEEIDVEFDMHYIVLDIDYPTQLIPSSTPGHFHLIIEKRVPKFAWIQVLLALSQAGIVQPGYAHASIEAGYTSIRLPWVRKGLGADQPLDGHPTGMDDMAVKTWAEHDKLRTGTILEKKPKKRDKGRSIKDLQQLSDVDEDDQDF